MNKTVERLNDAKIQKGLTLKQLAELSGLTLGTVIKIMNGEVQKIKDDKLNKLASALDVTTDYLKNGVTEIREENMANDYYGLVKIACVSPPMRVADCDYNTEQIINEARRANEKGVKIAVFPELCITGYTCGDLFFQEALRASAVKNLRKLCLSTAELDIICIVGLPVIDELGKLYNTAAVVYRGEILGVVPKVNLPNYNEFMEKRLFAPFDGDNREICLFGKRVPFGSKLLFANEFYPEVRFAIEICEDVWVANSPSITHSAMGANAIFNLSASNETIVKSEYRKKMIEIQSATCGVIYAYCSAGMDESTSQTVFSAHNLICENGELLAEAKPFTDGYAQAEADFGFIANERAKLDHSRTESNYKIISFSQKINGAERVYAPVPFVPCGKNERNDICEKALTILSYGLKKRIEHVNAKKLVIGVSGGSDSTLALVICKRALNLLNRPTSDILAVTMPCFGTSERTLNNSVALANEIGATVEKIDVSAAVTRHLEDIRHPIDKTDVTYENAQARERTQVLMDLANDCGGLVIGTGDMSELALGWATYNGDHMSMYGVNASVPKTLVKELIAYTAENSKGELKRVLSDVLATPVSPELLPLDKDGKSPQVTENAVGPYELHDYFLFMLVRKGFNPQKVYKLAKLSFAGKYDGAEIYKWMEKFIRRFFAQQFKRSCSPDSVKLGSVDISKIGLRMPSDANCNVWLDDLAKAFKKDGE